MNVPATQHATALVAKGAPEYATVAQLQALSMLCYKATKPLLMD